MWSVTVQNYLRSWVRTSDRDGMSPSVMHTSACDGSTNDPAKDTAHTVLNILVQRRSHTNAIWCVMKDGTSRAFAWANCQMKSTASLLHLPPVSRATTTRRHRPLRSSGYLFSLSTRACNRIAPSSSAAPGWASPLLVKALLRVTSTANCEPPKHGRSWASTSIRLASEEATLTFISLKRALNLTRAPASLQILAMTLSTGMALLWMRPEWEHAARWCPNGSSGSWQPEHVDSVRNRGNRNRSRNSTWNKCGWMVNSGVVGAWDNAHPELCPE